MLKQRVLTALVLAGIVLPVLFYPSPWPFCSLALVFMAVAAWEWGRLNACGSTTSLGFALGFCLLAVLTWKLGWLDKPMSVIWTLASGAWVLASAWLLKVGSVGWLRIPAFVRRLGGLVALWLAWVAVCQARIHGINFLLSVMALVWVADIFAYFTGRAFGGKFTASKLAPSISPGKSWEGVWGGFVGVLLLAAIWVMVDGYKSPQSATHTLSLYSQLLQQHGMLLLLTLLFLTAMSVVGDLVESLIKRSAGVKDSSNLLPGHGGVLDRIDALLPTLPIAMMLVGTVQ